MQNNSAQPVEPAGDGDDRIDQERDYAMRVRSALLAQASSLQDQRAAILMQVAALEKKYGIQTKRS